MLNDKQKQNLIHNWGEKADALACLSEVRVYDPASTWECYIYALNPEDEDECDCIVKVSSKQRATIERWFLTNISSLFNSEGEGVQIDEDYKPRMACELMKKLNENIIYDR